MPSDDWIDESEYPSEKDMDDLGDDSPFDYDVLSIGYVKGTHPPFWSRRNIIVLIVALLLLGVLILPPLIQWLG